MDQVIVPLIQEKVRKMNTSFRCLEIITLLLKVSRGRGHWSFLEKLRSPDKNVEPPKIEE